MRRNELLCHTGRDRGIVLNGAGENITDSAGAGNNLVGTWCRDFAGMFANVGPMTSLVDLTEAELSLVDNEWSIIIADGRSLDGDNLNDDNSALLDDESLNDDDGSFIEQSDSFALIDDIVIQMRFRCPDYRDASVYSATDDLPDVNDSSDYGYGVTPEPGCFGNLNAYLNTITDTIYEIDVDATQWALRFRNLRWTLHWAILVIPCSQSYDEGVVDGVAANNATAQVSSNPVPRFGPRGVMLKYAAGQGYTGATTQNDYIRLWHAESSPQCRIVERGEMEFPYDLTQATASTDPTASLDFDVGNPEAGVDTHYRIADGATGAKEGTNINLVVRCKRNIKVNDDELVVFCVQTGRARLGRFDIAGGNDEHHIIAGPQLVQGRNGPLITPYHWYARARGTTR